MSGVNPVQHDDDYARAILTAHEAYANALKLHDDIVAAAGRPARF